MKTKAISPFALFIFPSLIMVYVISLIMYMIGLSIHPNQDTVIAIFPFVYALVKLVSWGVCIHLPFIIFLAIKFKNRSALRILQFFLLLISLCVILFIMYSICIIIHKIGDGVFVTEPLVFSLNTFIPLGILSHVIAIILAIIKFKTHLLNIILQFILFIAISSMAVVYGIFLYLVLLGGHFSLNEAIWWLF